MSLPGVVRRGRKARGKGGFCCYCKRGPLLASTDPGKLAFTKDHINPQAKGGGRTVPCCRQCNGLKGSMSPREWFWFIDNHPGYWRDFQNHRQVEQAVARERVRRARAGEPPIPRRETNYAPLPYQGGQFNG